MKNLHQQVLATYVVLVALTFSSCKEEDTVPEIKPQSISGYVQKGPFINGSSVTVYDLQSDLSPTGKSYYSQIIDNNGVFRLKNIALSSSFIGLRADGFYFNEVSGEKSEAQINLNALTDISNKSSININLLTHLEKSRVEYLMENGNAFIDAKALAQKEILAIFNIDKDIRSSEDLNINETGDDNGALLAISVLLQGYRSESELTELLSNISNDIREDGILDDESLGSALINHAVYLDTAAIKSNLTKRYSDTGATVSIPDFGKYITNFIDNTEFKSTESIIKYPSEGLYGKNILSLTDSVYSRGDYSLFASIPENMSLKVILTALNPGGIWFYLLGTGHNWSINTFSNGEQTFTAIDSGTTCDLHMRDFKEGKYLIQYFETKSTKPTRQKIIRIK